MAAGMPGNLLVVVRPEIPGLHPRNAAQELLNCRTQPHIAENPYAEHDVSPHRRRRQRRISTSVFDGLSNDLTAGTAGDKSGEGYPCTTRCLEMPRER